MNSGVTGLFFGDIYRFSFLSPFYTVNAEEGSNYHRTEKFDGEHWNLFSFISIEYACDVKVIQEEVILRRKSPQASI